MSSIRPIYEESLIFKSEVSRNKANKRARQFYRITHPIRLKPQATWSLLDVQHIATSTSQSHEWMSERMAIPYVCFAQSSYRNGTRIVRLCWCVCISSGSMMTADAALRYGLMCPVLCIDFLLACSIMANHYCSRRFKPNWCWYNISWFLEKPAVIIGITMTRWYPSTYIFCFLIFSPFSPSHLFLYFPSPSLSLAAPSPSTPPLSSILCHIVQGSKTLYVLLYPAHQSIA